MSESDLNPHEKQAMLVEVIMWVISKESIIAYFFPFPLLTDLKINYIRKKKPTKIQNEGVMLNRICVSTVQTLDIVGYLEGGSIVIDYWTVGKREDESMPCSSEDIFVQ